VVIVENGEEVMLGTAPELSEMIANLQKEELNKELSKASLETLSILLYKNGATRSEIDYIRGVNTSFTLRALSVRGLVEKTTDLNDNRRFIYKPSFELLSYMGVKSVEELPEFTEVNKGIESAVKENLQDGNQTA
jgi:segregation and condensation protein B